MGRFDDLEIIDEQGRYHVTNPHTVTLAEHLLALFIQERPRYVPGPVRVGKKSLKHFYKAAEMCRAAEMTPEAFIAQQLEAMAQKGTFYPNAIASPKLEEAVPTHHMQRSQKLRYYKSQLALFRDRATMFSPRSALTDRANQFSPLVRCVLAYELGFSDIGDSYVDEAKHERAATDIADEIFGDLLRHLDDR